MDFNPFNAQPVAPKEQPQNALLPDTSTTTTLSPTAKEIPLESTEDGIVDISVVDPSALDAVTLSAVFYAINALFLIACLVARKCTFIRRSTSVPTVNSMLQLHGQRLSISNFLMATILMLATVWIVKYNDSTRMFCYEARDQSMIALLVVAFSSCICCIRFITYIYSEGDAGKGADGKDAQKNFDPAKSDVFVDTTNLLMKICALVFFAVALCVFEFAPSFILERLLQFSVCVPVDMPSKVFVILLICGVVHGSIILTEIMFLDNFKLGLHFMQKVLEGKHVITTLSMTGGGWLFLLLIVWLFSTYAVQCIILAQLFATLDAMWSFVICVSVPNAKQNSLFV